MGLVRSSFVWKPDLREVSEVFTIPLKLAIDHRAYSHQKVNHEGKTVVISSLQWQGHKIWGITAAILLNFGSRMEGSICESLINHQ